MMNLELTSLRSPAAQNILLYQRLTKVLAKLTHGVEIDIQKHMENLELRFKKAGTAAQDLEPQFDRLREKLVRIEDYVSHNLEHALKNSAESINTGLHDATNLQRLIAMTLQSVLEGTSHVAASQEKSVQLANQNNDDMDKWSAVITAAAATAMSLNKQIVRIFTSASVS